MEGANIKTTDSFSTLEDIVKWHDRKLVNIKLGNLISEAMKSEDMESEDVKPEDIKSDDIKSKDVNSGDIKSKGVKSEDIRSEDITSEDMILEDMKSDRKLNDSKSKDIKPKDMASKDTKLKGVKLKDIKPKDLKLKDIKLKESKDLKSKDLKLKDLKSKDLKSKDLKSKDPKSKDIKKSTSITIKSDKSKLSKINAFLCISPEDDHSGSDSEYRSSISRLSLRRRSKRDKLRKNNLKHPELQNMDQGREHPKSELELNIETLSEILTSKSHREEGTNGGIHLNTFTRYLFPRYPVLAEKLFAHFLSSAQAKNAFITSGAFKQQCERYLGILDDGTIRDTLVNMFSVINHETENRMMTRETFRELLMCTYHVSMDHYSEGPQMCLSINKTLAAVIEGCFHVKNQLSSQFVSHWIELHCPRLLLPLHRFSIHSLATSYRTLEMEGPTLAAGLELATPVLDKIPAFGPGMHPHPHLLQMSMSWLLAGALPQTFSRPQKAHSPSSSGVGLASVAFMSKLLCSLPSHWMVLYDSDENGLGANRFLHHVLAYKGPTLVLLKVDNGSLFCIACPNEWKESHLYWGTDDACVFQLLPKFILLEKAPKMLYLNLGIRGYPHGLRAGKDPRNPIISVNGSFEKMEYQKIPFNLKCIEVWGCGDTASREKQLDVKKWQVKEAERQRCVKLTADDWLDHPDRYLLELGGRPQYNNRNQS